MRFGMQTRSLHNLLFYFLVFGFTVSCNYKDYKHPGYTYNEKGYYSRLLAFSDKGIDVSPRDYVFVHAQFFLGETDSVLSTESFIMQVVPGQNCFSDILLDFRKGDSIACITPNEECYTEVLFPEFAELLSHQKELRFIVSIQSVTSEQEYEEEQRRYALWLESRRELEHVLIQDFLQKQPYSYSKTPLGLYKFTVKQGSGNPPNKGDLVTIKYQGSLLEGDIINHFTTLEFRFGSEWQVIQGIEIALASMQEGERALLIIPSEFAWGEHGTSDTSIEPFTTVIFDLELVGVERL